MWFTLLPAALSFLLTYFYKTSNPMEMIVIMVSIIMMVLSLQLLIEKEKDLEFMVPVSLYLASFALVYIGQVISLYLGYLIFGVTTAKWLFENKRSKA